MLSHSELKKLCADIDILISEFDTIDDDIMSNSTMKLIICCRSGVSTVVDLESAKKHGIVVCNNVGRNREATADFTIGLIFDLIRNISLTNNMIHSNRLSQLIRPMPSEYGDSLWGLDNQSPYVKYRGRSIKDITVGIIGYGQVGQSVAERLSNLGVDYIIHSSNREEIGRFTNMETLLSKSDVVTLHVSGNIFRKPIFTSKEFSMMKKTAYFINTSRGYLVDENALYNALVKKQIAGAAIDVLAEEPAHPDNILLTLDNIIITPHIAGSSDDTIIYGTKMVMDALIGYVKNEIPNRVV